MNLKRAAIIVWAGVTLVIGVALSVRGVYAVGETWQEEGIDGLFLPFLFGGLSGLAYGLAIRAWLQSRPEALIRRAATEAQGILNELYSKGETPPDSALDQLGLRDGLEIVNQYLAHGEFGLALEHLVYMVSEPQLNLSDRSQSDMKTAAAKLGMTLHI